MIQFDEHIFSDGWVENQPTTKHLCNPHRFQVQVAAAEAQEVEVQQKWLRLNRWTYTPEN